MALTPKQYDFVLNYIRDFNATQAAIRAGYSEKTAGQMGHELLKKPEISEAVTEAMEGRFERTRIDADYVLTQAAKLHERCMQEIEPFTDAKGNHVHDAKGRPLYVFNSTGAAKALEIMGKHVDVQAFREKMELTGPGGGPLQTITTDMTPQQAAEAYAETVDGKNE